MSKDKLQQARFDWRQRGEASGRQTSHWESGDWTKKERPRRDLQSSAGCLKHIYGQARCSTDSSNGRYLSKFSTVTVPVRERQLQKTTGFILGTRCLDPALN